VNAFVVLIEVSDQRENARIGGTMRREVDAGKAMFACVDPFTVSVFPAQGERLQEFHSCTLDFTARPMFRALPTGRQQFSGLHGMRHAYRKISDLPPEN